ncbi:MAG: hypothetical protein ABR505_05930 [Actinomycetota bacterium]
MARFHSVKKLRTSAEPKDVIDLLSRPDQRPNWQPEILWMRGPDRLAEGDEQYGRARMMGFEVAGRSRTIAASNGVFEEEALIGVRLRIRYEITDADGGIEIAHHLTADLPRGFWGRIVSLFLRSRLRVMQLRALRNLAAQTEPESSS